jgi:hypothetical protein
MRSVAAIHDVPNRSFVRAATIAALLVWPRTLHAEDGGDGMNENRIGGVARAYEENWLGLHVAQDVTIVGGHDVCSRASQATEGFACFEHDTATPFIGQPVPGIANRIATGYAFATTRFLLSYDRAFTPNTTLGARGGYAIGGGPAAAGGAAFSPIHAELRGSYWFGDDVLANKGFRPYLHVGGGIAQVDAKFEVTVIDCSSHPTLNEPVTDVLVADCLSGAQQPPAVGRAKKLDAYKKVGQGFGTAGGGVVFAIQEDMGLQLNLNLMLMLPRSGFVIEPSLGFVYGL